MAIALASVALVIGPAAGAYSASPDASPSAPPSDWTPTNADVGGQPDWFGPPASSKGSLGAAPATAEGCWGNAFDPRKVNAALEWGAQTECEPDPEYMSMTVTLQKWKGKKGKWVTVAYASGSKLGWVLTVAPSSLCDSLTGTHHYHEIVEASAEGSPFPQTPFTSDSVEVDNCGLNAL
jgi:hypothetical protein